MKIREHRFVQKLADENSKFLRKRGISFFEEYRLGTSVPKRQRYLIDCFIQIGEIETNFNQLIMASLFISKYRTSKEQKAYSFTRFDFVVYHYENYLFRITGLLDRVLILVNKVIRLGFDDKNCKPYLFLVDEKGQQGKYSERIIGRSKILFNVLVELQGVTEKFREARDMISHRSRFSSTELNDVELLSITLAESTFENEQEKLTIIKLHKIETDDAVKNIKEEMKVQINKVNKLLETIYDELLPIWEERYFNIYN